MHDGAFLVRGKEISRVEGLSDAVFGFSITLLVVSLEVPRNAADVLHAMRGFFAFAVTFTILFVVWRKQFVFFRRYGLEDNTTVNLTAVLLFVILFFVYPLKFVFGTLVDRLMLHAGYISTAEPMRGPGFHLLYVAFALGWSAVAIVFALLYRHAYALREALNLTPIEAFDTRESMWRAALSSIPGFLTAAMSSVLYFHPSVEDAIVYPYWAALAGALVLIVRRRRRARGRRAAILERERHVVEA